MNKTATYNLFLSFAFESTASWKHLVENRCENSPGNGRRREENENCEKNTT
jgi:hypothetical protein